MRQALAIAAAALASLWASAAWSASVSGPSDDGTSLTFAPSGTAVASPAGILDPAFRPGTFAAVLAEPPASTIAFHFGNDAISGDGLIERDLASAPASFASPLAGQPGLSLRDIVISVALTPDVDLNFAQGRDLAAIGAFGGGASSYDSLFLGTAGQRSPYLSLTDGGLYAGITLHLADTLQLRIGHAALGADSAARQGLLANATLNTLPHDLALQLAADGRSAGATAVGIDWNFADWGTLGITASRAGETGSLLGNTAPIAIANASETAALGISARVGFGSGWVTTISYSEGVTQFDLRARNFAPAPGTLRTRAYGITIAKEGVFGGDTIGFSLSRPLQMYDGDPGLLGRVGLDGRTNNLGFGDGSGLLGGAPESDIEFGYVTSFLGGALALQTNAAYQMNAGGQRGQGAVSVVSRAKINF
jgi:hypothetical protein